MASELRAPHGDLDMPWRRCPNNLPELTDWAQFTFDPAADSHLTPYLFAYRNVGAQGLHAIAGLHKILFKLHGFMRKIQLDSLGNWEETLEHAPKAEQIFALHGGSVPHVFLQEVTAMKNVLQYCLGAAGSEFVRGDELIFRRKIFNKVTTANQALQSIVTTGDDPSGATKLIEHSWRIIRRLCVSRRRNDNSLEHINIRRLRTDDFVEVSAHVEIEMVYCESEYPVIDIRLEPVSILRIVPYNEVDEALMVDDEDESEDSQ
ncbi:hypothetical protein FA95DRAFT_1600230 [Auriscalpium vulgare]|uniref:Uncharacterized protein n=1 Tax=Auriscalpium vulgare TaxID=40419 RepID=A0ACB8R234_9AGAM|nr:hypothetical protein FA95DRAFT_1600230 [Auriscalpium vulgare]